MFNISLLPSWSMIILIYEFYGVIWRIIIIISLPWRVIKVTTTCLDSPDGRGLDWRSKGTWFNSRSGWKFSKIITVYSIINHREQFVFFLYITGLGCHHWSAKNFPFAGGSHRPKTRKQKFIHTHILTITVHTLLSTPGEVPTDIV